MADGSLGASVQICRPGGICLWRGFCFFKSKDKFLQIIFVNLQVVVTFPVMQFVDGSNSFFLNEHSCC